jgi:hypothetical protein
MVAHEIIVRNGTTVSNGIVVKNGSAVPLFSHSYVIHPLLYLDTLVSLGNIVLLLLLLYVYWGNYKKIKSNFTLGLIMFAALLLLQNILFSSFLLFHQAFRVADLGLPLFILNITEFLALAILLIITWK